jgi:hypothetical protein
VSFVSPPVLASPMVFVGSPRDIRFSDTLKVGVLRFEPCPCPAAHIPYGGSSSHDLAHTAAEASWPMRRDCYVFWADRLIPKLEQPQGCKAAGRLPGNRHNLCSIKFDSSSALAFSHGFIAMSDIPCGIHQAKEQQTHVPTEHHHCSYKHASLVGLSEQCYCRPVARELVSQVHSLRLGLSLFSCLGVFDD